MGGPRLVARAVAAGAAGCLLLGPAASAAGPAERKQEVDQSIESLEHALEGTSAELAQAAVALRQTEARLPAAEAELAAAQERLAEARAKDAELASRLAAAEEAEAKANQALEAGDADIEETHETLGQIASQAYRGGTATPGLAIALSASSPSDFADRYMMIDTALRTQGEALADLREQQALRAHAEARLDAVRDEVERLRLEAAANLEVARAAEAEAAERKQEIEQLQARQRQALAVIEQRKAEEMQRLDRLEAERAALEAELRRLEAERRRAEERERARREAEAAAEREREGRRSPPSSGRSADRPRAASSSGLAYPLNAPVTSHYGYRIHPIYGTRRLHSGTDFGAACGTPVRAAASGSVVRAGVNGGYGNQVVLQHGSIRGSGVATSYNHLSRYAVRSGSVSQGEVIGYVGTTGTSTGCHLHFEVYVNGSATNPMGWL